MHFELVSHQHKDIIFDWLDKPHMREFWDNSQEHRDDILHFIDGRKTPGTYFNGIMTYWIGSEGNAPYAFILTSPIYADEELSELWRKNLSKTGNTYGLDYGIGNERFLGKGLAAPTLRAFMDFFRAEVDPKADTFFIDPDNNNLRAKHVYEQAGFVPVGNFMASRGFFVGHEGCLMIRGY